MRPEHGEIGTKIGNRLDPQREKLAVLIEGEFHDRTIVPGLVVHQEVLGPIALLLVLLVGLGAMSGEFLQRYRQPA